ncbi:MAG: hypothetical protein HOP12_02450 [Candidatus Eisenbacteria bacterium]|uniref:Response regulatory domain-containing protein n=1 Tax=Eiseniibacteriota bacterium TaxID=2212470 RepID=A0A849SNL7_UNCEI|nr:hypothetical protein [Candidatus Eisenbacteria bacterium]
MSRILIFDPNEHDTNRLSLLTDKAQEVVRCRDRHALLKALSAQRPDVLVYVVQSLLDDLVLLSSLRAVAPTLPIIMIGGPTDLESRRSIQELRPTYYGVLPLEPSELRDAVRGALQRGSGRR